MTFRYMQLEGSSRPSCIERSRLGAAKPLPRDLFLADGVEALFEKGVLGGELACYLWMALHAWPFRDVCQHTEPQGDADDVGAQIAYSKSRGYEVRRIFPPVSPKAIDILLNVGFLPQIKAYDLLNELAKLREAQFKVHIAAG
jgi:hypothetical protein